MRACCRRCTWSGGVQCSLIGTVSTAVASWGFGRSLVTQSAYYEHRGLLSAVGLFSGHVLASHNLFRSTSLVLRKKVAKGEGEGNPEAQWADGVL